MRVRLRRGDGWSRSGEGSLVARSPEAYQEPPGAAKVKRKRHLVSLGGPRRTLVRRSCSTDEGPLPLRPRSCWGRPIAISGIALGRCLSVGTAVSDRSWAGVCQIASG